MIHRHRRYEVRFVNSFGLGVRTEHFDSDRIAQARALRDKHAYSEPKAEGWTIWISKAGEAEQPGLLD